MADNVKSIKDFEPVINQAGQVFASFPEELQDFLGELENPTLAIYAMQKSGVLEQLPYMAPQEAYYQVMQHMEKAQSFLNAPQNRVTGAPAPMKQVKGASAVKSSEEMSGKELLKRYKINS